MVTPTLSPVGPQTDSKSSASPKLAAAAQQFESVLLGQWLQSAESSFAAVPGGDDDADAGTEQMRGFATQQLATGFTASGGIGIAKLVLGALSRANDQEQAKAAAAQAGNAAAGLSAQAAVAAYNAEAKR